MQNISSKKQLITGAISLTSILVVLVAALIGYTIYKMQMLETKLVAMDTKLAAVSTGGGGGAVQPTPAPVDLTKVKALFTDKTNITFGDANRKVLFVEFADPSCPYCHIAVGMNSQFNATGQFQTVEKGGSYVPPVPEIKKLVDSGKASYALVYANGHGAGELAAAALYCAHEKGNFWKAHDKLYTSEGYDLVNNEVKNDKANSAKLATFLASTTDKAAMQSCLETGKYTAKVSQDMQLAQALGYGGTPTFFMNEQRYNGAYSYKDMEGAIQAAL